MKKKIIVTGATGFIGKKLCNKLLQSNYDLISLSSHDGNISDLDFFSKYDGQLIEHVFHLAAKTFVPKSWENPNSFIHTNVMGTASVLDFCRRSKCSLTYVSAYVYGADVMNPISEDAKPNPNNPYALSKKMGEDLCEFYSKYYNVIVNIIRPFNIYGPEQSEDFLIPYLVKQIKSNEDVIKVKDLSPKRDYIHVDDVVECILAAMNHKHFDVFNVGYGESHSVAEVIETLFRLSQRTVPIISESNVRNNEISDTISDISKAKNILKWEPKIRLEEGLKNLF